MQRRDTRRQGALMTATMRVPAGEEHLVHVSGMENMTRRVDGDSLVITGQRHNAYVNTGLNNSLDREFGLGGNAVSRMGVTNDTTAVTATTTKLDPTDNDTVIIKAFDTAATRTNQTVSAVSTFTKSDGNIAYTKVGLLTTTTDAGTGLVNVIGGGGTAPYDESFSIDLTGTTDFSVTIQLDVTAAAT
jgi:hypothetical protein